MSGRARGVRQPAGSRTSGVVGGPHTAAVGAAAGHGLNDGLASQLLVASLSGG